MRTFLAPLGELRSSLRRIVLPRCSRSSVAPSFEPGPPSRARAEQAQLLPRRERIAAPCRPLEFLWRPTPPPSPHAPLTFDATGCARGRVSHPFQARSSQTKNPARLLCHGGGLHILFAEGPGPIDSLLPRPAVPRRGGACRESGLETLHLRRHRVALLRSSLPWPPQALVAEHARQKCRPLVFPSAAIRHAFWPLT